MPVLASTAVTMETVESLVSSVLGLATTAISYLVANPVMGIGIGCAIAGTVFGLARRALRTAR